MDFEELVMTKEQCEDFIKDLPDYFYIALFGEMCSIDPSITYKQISKIGGYGCACGTGLWVEAMKMSCMKLGIKDFMHKYNCLDCDNSDSVDYAIENKMIEVIKKEKENNSNSYYKYICNL